MVQRHQIANTSFVFTLLLSVVSGMEKVDRHERTHTHAHAHMVIWASVQCTRAHVHMRTRASMHVHKHKCARFVRTHGCVHMRT